MSFFSRLFYYGFILPFSLLPFRVLYIISDAIFLVFFYVIGYRRKVVMSNLRKSFPEKSDAERKVIAKKFYRHFCDMVVESLKMFSISDEEARKRGQYRNVEILNEYYDQGRSVVMAAGHFGNWELAAVTFNQNVKHHGITIYQPLTNQYLDRKIRSSRTKFGLGVMHIRKVKEEFERLRGTLTATAFLVDQSPSAHAKKHWMTFLGQETAVVLGVERFATEFDYPVVFIHVEKPKRGYYIFIVSKVCDKPRELKPGEITEMATRIIEADIRQRPELWLWTHRRWKHQKADFPGDEQSPQ